MKKNGEITYAEIYCQPDHFRQQRYIRGYLCRA